MRYYSFSEIGMLIGMAIGGAIASIGILATGSALFLGFGAICTAAGIITGSMFDKKH
ncbi:MAG TPA: hypothetical protein GXX14_08860 [Clostridiaceae bacterium]|nr:hypothetical protein [Clostridiaceae bacterium]